MAQTAQALLDALDDAILAFLQDEAIQEYTYDGVTVKRADLNTLMQRRDALRAEIASGKAGGAVNYFRRGPA